VEYWAFAHTVDIVEHCFVMDLTAVWSNESTKTTDGPAEVGIWWGARKTAR